MVKNNKLWLVLGFMVIAAMLLASCGPAPTPTPVPTAVPLTFVMGMAGDAVRLDPADYNDGQTAARAEQIFETLYEFDGATTNVKPALAESYTVTPDGKEWTFKLRQGVKFHDGTPFNADAVVWNFVRQWDEKHPFHAKEYATLTWEYWHDVIGWGFKGEKGAIMQDIVKVDDYTVKFVLSEPQAPFIINIAIFSNGIASPASFEKNKTDAFKNPVGTGPFKFVEWVKDDHITLVKNPDYWGKPMPYIDKLVFRVIKDNSARYLALKAGDIQGMGEGANPDDAKAAASDPNLQVISRPPLNVGYVAFNQKVKPLDNKNVRLAIAYAINKKAIVDNLYGGVGILATQFLPNSLWGWNPDIKDVSGDPEKAKSLLKEAGLEKGFQAEILTSSKRMVGYGDLAQILQADLRKIGIDAKVLDVEQALYDNRTLVKGDIVTMVHTYGRAGRDPGSLVAGALAWTNGWKEGNWTHFESAEWERWRKELTSTLDMDRRKAAARKLQEIALDECFTIPVAPALRVFAYASYVKGFGVTMDNSIHIGDMWLDK